MVQSPSILVYISLLTIGELVICENAVENKTKVLTTTSANKVQTITPWRDNRIVSHPTRGCDSAPNDSNTTCEGIITTTRYKTTKRPTTTYKPKTSKPQTSKANNSKAKNSKVNNPTTGPKSDKRMSNNGPRKSLPSVNQKRTLVNNQTTANDGSINDFKTMYPVNIWKVNGFYTEDYIHLINSHWFKFEPPNSTSHYVLGLLYTIIMIFGCFGNSLVIFMYTKLVTSLTHNNYNNNNNMCLVWGTKLLFIIYFKNNSENLLLIFKIRD